MAAAAKGCPFTSSRLGASVVCFSLVGTLALAQSAPLRASLTELKNQVDKRLSERTSWQAARLQDILQTDNSVRTGSNSIAELTYGDASITRLAPNTTLTLQQQQNRILHLLLGKIWVRITKGGARTQIKTPSAIATVIGTDVLCSVDPDQTSSFTVLNTDPGHQLAVQALDPTSNLTVGDQSTAGSAQQIVVEPGQPAPPAQDVDVQQILQQEQGSGFLTEAHTTTAAASPGATSEPTAQPTSQPTTAATTAPTAGPVGVVPTAAPGAAPTPVVEFNPVQDAPVLPSQELDRTGSDVTGRVNVIIEHDGPPR